MKYLSEDDFSEARDLFSSLKGFRDSEKKVKESAYREAESRFSQGKYADAERLYDLSGDYVDDIRQPEEAELHQAIKLYLDGKNEEAIALSYKLISTNDAKETEYYKKCCDVAYNLASECCQTSANRVVVKTAYLIFDCLSNENYPGGCSVWKEKCVGKILVPEGQYKSQSKGGSNHSSSSSYIKNLTFSVDAETLYILVSGEWSLDKGSIKDSKVYGINSDYDPYCLIQIGEDQYTLFFVDNCIRAYKKTGEKNVLYAVYEKYE